MPPGYGGVSWPNNIGICTGFSPSIHCHVSPNRVLFNYNFPVLELHESLVTFIGGPKIFDGAYFSGYDDVQFNLYNGATLVGTSSILYLGDLNTPAAVARHFSHRVTQARS